MNAEKYDVVAAETESMTDQEEVVIVPVPYVNVEHSYIHIRKPVFKSMLTKPA